MYPSPRKKIVKMMSKLFRNVLWFDSLEMSSKALMVQIVTTGFFDINLVLQG
jgi:hypothetical protein